MKYQSELIKEIVDKSGHVKSTIHYQSECIEQWIEENKGAYPKLCDYQGEWLYYINENPIGKFPYETITDVTEATVNNVVPYAYRSAILKGNTKYHDIDTGDILDTFDESKNLELVSVIMPVLKTCGKNLCDNSKNKAIEIDYTTGAESASTNNVIVSDYIEINPLKTYTASKVTSLGLGSISFRYYNSKKEYIGTDKTNEAKYVRLRQTNPNGSLNLDDILFQLEEGSTATTYEPYKSNILTTSEEVTLRGIGDVKDELSLLTGEVTKRIGEVTLDGGDDEEWIAYGGGSDTHQRFVLKRGNRIKPISNVNENKFLCDKFKPVKNITDENSQEMCLMEGYDDWYASIIIDNTKLNSVTVDGFKSWLQSNNVKMLYVVENESIKTVDLIIQDQDGNTLRKIKPIEGTMHIMTNGTPIKPTASLEIPVEAITQNLMNFVNIEVEE